ncbi:SIMPL domain-containing protein [Oricola thermophila]|uniref:SIMPL domain-containing protein n=1 Tax=Oricola thermophila TaxID=2742145 RepID=A0A6N1VD52_9HYPH|nr:SIMPL domain-containing protein [Oricola thermophila]QKV18856.1 SIMPL domain-containing protein [Oricola thermophila]
MTFTRNAIFSMLVLAGIAAAPQAVLAQQNEPTPRIVVSGEGRAEIAPDMAVLTLSVVREAETARQALDANTAAMADVLAALQAEGIEERDLQTSNFSIDPKIVYPKKNADGTRGAPQIVGYTVRNSLTVRIRDLGKLGAILDKSVTLGVNQGGGIAFTNDDPSEAIEEARVKAMQEAIAKAKTLTGTAGIGLGKVLEISESSYRPQPVPMARAEMLMDAAKSAPVPVAAGENTYSVTVNVTFALEQ